MNFEKFFRKARAQFEGSKSYRVRAIPTFETDNFLVLELQRFHLQKTFSERYE